MRAVFSATISTFCLYSACGPRGVQTTDPTGTEGDADTDTDSDSDTDADADTDTDTDTDTIAGCGSTGPTPGPWADHPITLAGATVTRSPYTHDAGVGALIAATQGAMDPTPVDIEITGAIVTARGYLPATATTANFWFEDASGPMYAFDVDLGGAVAPADLMPGDEISFRATEVQQYFDTLEVTAIADFEVTSRGNPVHVVDAMTGAPITVAEHMMEVVEVWGELVSGPTDCGASCFDLQYGSNTVTFRTGSSYTVQGDCVHWMGPVSSFSGAVQLDADDFDWYTYY